MKCCDVESILGQFASGSIDEDNPDHTALRAHLATCPTCQHTLRSLSQWDAQLIRAMNDVVVPPGLSQRLTMTLNEASSVDPISNLKVAMPVRRKAWSRILTSLTAVCLLSVSIWGAWLFVQPPALSSANVTDLLQESVENLPVAENSRQSLPHQWSSLPGRVVSGDWKELRPSNLRVTIAVIPFEVRSKRSPSVKGSLFAIPKSRWTPTPANSVSQAAIHYAPPYVWVAWSERDVVYVLALNGPSPLLEQLQRQLDGNHAVL